MIRTTGDRRRNVRLGLLVACLALLPSTVLASPPPPPPEYIDSATRVLTVELRAQNFIAYSAVFADDLRVFIDGRQVASDKCSWLGLEKTRLGKVERRLVGYAEGVDDILIVDEFDDRSGLPTDPGLLFDPRFVTRSARYQFGPDRLVHEIRFVQGGGFWRLTKRGG